MFADFEHQNSFDEKGYTCFRIISINEVEKLRSIYAKYESAHNQSREKFRGTGWVNDSEIINALTKEVGYILNSFLGKFFTNHQILGYNFLLKENGLDTEVLPHQDWTYVDETRFYSLNIWIALEDTEVANGTLFVVPGSQKIFKGYLRPAPEYPIPFLNERQDLKKISVPVTLKAGECICFNNRTIHGSYSNHSQSNRLAIVATIYPKDAELLHHYVHDKTHPETVTEYKITPMDFLSISRGQPPQNHLSKMIVQTKYPKMTFWDLKLKWIAFYLISKFYRKFRQLTESFSSL
jgi:hypothetical protein